MKNLERESLLKLECAAADIEEITKMLWYTYEDYYSLQKDDIYTKADNYDRLGTYLINIHSLLLSQQKEMNEFIDKVYEEMKSEKQENEKIEAIS